MAKSTSTNAENKAYLKSVCPMQYTMEQLSGRWKILLLWYIHLGANRFGLLRKGLPKLTTKMLSQQLKELERDGFVTKKIFPVMPPHVEYSVTPRTKSLIPIFKKFNEWGKIEMAKNRDDK